MSETVNLSLIDYAKLDSVNRNAKRAANAAMANTAATLYAAEQQQQTRAAVNALQNEVRVVQSQLSALQAQQVNSNITGAQSFVASQPIPADKTQTGINYLFGINGTVSNPFVAYVYLKQAADEGSLMANYYMGDMARSGSVYPANLQLAKNYYLVYVTMYIEQFCETVQDVNEVAGNYFDGENNFAKNRYVAFLFWNQVENYNNPNVLGNLGNCYQHGFGVAKDIPKALQCYEKALKLGDNTYSLNRIGVLHWFSEYGMKNDKLAIECWMKAAFNGDKNAAENLGTNYKDTKAKILKYLKWPSIFVGIGIVLMVLGAVFNTIGVNTFGEFVLLIALIRLIVQTIKHRNDYKLLKKLKATVTDSDGTTYTPNYKDGNVIITRGAPKPVAQTVPTPTLPAETTSEAQPDPQTSSPSGPQTQQ